MGPIFVFAEERVGSLERVAFELLGEARRLARETGAKLGALLLGAGAEPLAGEIAEHGADTIYVVSDPRLRRYDPESFLATVGSLCAAHQPSLVLFPATPTGSDLAARLAAERGWPLVPQCVSVRYRNGDFELTRAIDDKVHAVIAAVSPGPRLATIPPDTLGVGQSAPNGTATIIPCEMVVPQRPRVEIRDFIAADPKTLDLAEADVVVAAGRGVGSRENMQLVEALAVALGGSVGGSRVAVDLGWLPRERQIGQTGRTVRPRLYVACGISGATQHMIGMKESATIVAINTDPGAPIFRVADLALEGDVRELLPALAEACQRARKAS